MQKESLPIEREIDETHREMKTLLKWAIALALLFGVPWGGCQLALHNQHLSFVPEAMGVGNVAYVSEQSWGFGPGGNETGILIFDMPEAVAESLETQGIAYLEQLPRNARQGWEGRYTEWHETPVAMPPDWGSSSFEGIKYWHSPGIGDYLNKYGFPVPLDLYWEQFTNAAISARGSYYAYGRIGLIILVPRERRIIYAYNG